MVNKIYPLMVVEAQIILEKSLHFCAATEWHSPKTNHTLKSYLYLSTFAP